MYKITCAPKNNECIGNVFVPTRHLTMVNLGLESPDDLVASFAWDSRLITRNRHLETNESSPAMLHHIDKYQLLSRQWADVLHLKIATQSRSRPTRCSYLEYDITHMKGSAAGSRHYNNFTPFLTLMPTSIPLLLLPPKKEDVSLYNRTYYRYSRGI